MVEQTVLYVDGFGFVTMLSAVYWQGKGRYVFERNIVGQITP
mgnify:CR=1 FL=1